MSEHAHVQQAFNELKIGVEQGSEDRLVSGRKRLAALGIDPKVPERAYRAELAAQQRQAAAADPATTASASTPPRDRRSPTADQSTT